jgi:hypothetical protein
VNVTRLDCTVSGKDFLEEKRRRGGERRRGGGQEEKGKEREESKNRIVICLTMNEKVNFPLGEAMTAPRVSRSRPIALLFL